ncbi:hypothetical protein GQF01_13135 [Paenibacillus sp. 5J-6]|uniref:Uncharacterized protein n=2 Tax=Paenibacillus silvestris TaxID=2606219 RepID=A0A6L8V0G3_9BACL|nr:hypothetical protein [Paenibacillus silvestris]
MIVKMTQQELGLVTKDTLCHVCFKPLIQAYKERVADQSVENSSIIMEQFYNELTNGQKALFSFQVYYNHAIKSLLEFYWWSAYFMAQPKIWLAIKAGLKYFEGDRMLNILENVEVTLKKSNHPISLNGFHVIREDMMHDENLLASISLLRTAFDEAAAETLQIINDRIQNNLHEFIEV